MRAQATPTADYGKVRLMRIFSRFAGVDICDLRVRHGFMEVSWIYGAWISTDLLIKHVAAFGVPK